MNYNEALGILYLFLLIVLIVDLAQKRYQKDKSEEQEPLDFSHLTVKEQLAIANKTAEMISDLEQLITDMQESRIDDIMMLHIEWIGRDDRQHEISIGCDGYNTATECMTEIAEREAEDLKNELAHQCTALSDHGRHRQNRGHISMIRRGEALEDDEAMHTMRSVYLNR